MKLNRKSIYILLAVVLLAGLLVYNINSSGVDNGREVKQNLENTEIISIGTIGDDAVRKIELFQPTADYIAEKLSDNKTTYKGKVIIAKTLDNLSDLLKEQKVDLFVESPLTAAVIANKSGSVPFLRRWKNGIGYYYSVFIVRKNSSISTADDLVGKTVIFEDPASTSGYLLPKAYLRQKGYSLNQPAGENSIGFVFSGNDDNTPIWVIEGKADAGVMSDIDFKKLPDTQKSELRIIDRTTDLPRHIVSRRSDLDPVMVEKIRQILLDMDKDPVGIGIMNDFEKTKKYDEITGDEMNNINKIFNSLE
ncbi:MAG: phosphate/phosphite/phosphonate ABC transporter substrate-binding protein [Candidatus Methanoperedens sp.]|nr:phosphate/phosphite/phosphonate ABC transporter substrate-binding protein [Candidatus Methanoperedens sp.]